MAGAIAVAGGLGSLACAYETPDRIGELMSEARARSNGGLLALNLFVDEPPPTPSAASLQRAHDRLRSYRDELGIPHPETPPLPPFRLAQQIDAVIAARPDVFSFIFGIPDAATLARFRAAGIATLGTATTVPEAIALERAGIDAVVAQGSESGAHRGSWLLPVHESLVGTLALVPQIVDAVRIPVIAAGGIADARGVNAVLALGARAAMLGTALLLSDESAVSRSHRAALQSLAAHGTVLTNVFSGRYARGIANRFVNEISDPHDIAPFPYQNAITRDVRSAAAAQDRPEFQSLWTGQGIALARSESTSEILTNILGQLKHES